MLKIKASTRSLVERLCDIKIYAISVLSFIGSVCAPDQATIKAENDALQCTTAGPYNAITSELLEVGSVCGLGPDLVGIHSIRLAARYCCGMLIHTSQRFGKSQYGTWTQFALLSLLYLPLGNMSFPSMTFNTANAFDIISLLDRNDTLDDVPKNKKAESCHWAASRQTP